MLGLPKYVLYHNKITAESYGLAAPKQPVSVFGKELSMFSVTL